VLGYTNTLPLPPPAACTPIGNSSVQDVTCTNAGDSQAGLAFACKDGFYVNNNEAPTPDTCEPCTAIPNSNNASLTCTNATDSVGDPKNGFECDAGYGNVLDANGFVVSCRKCPDILNSNNVGLACGEQGVCG
jgi:hypothetical protein